ncbi:MAG: alpha/beta fold hydrolase [Nitratireductor sp.]|nr:alpha/beta fold hydrolase [Nitratireductor sp.]
MFHALHHLDWETDGARWPNRKASRFLTIGNIRWHVQVMGPAGAPDLLLLHGTGASSHSWRDVMPMLAKQFRVIAPDLPGHGFTQASGSDLSLDGMARGLARLLQSLEAKPAIAVGHSAAAAILMQMALDGSIAPMRIIGFNSALKPIEGDAIFSPLAKLLFINPFVPRAFSSWARISGAADRLLARTRSQIDAEGKELYALLLSSPAHVAGALGMMANWDLAPLRARMGKMPCPVTLVATEDDGMVPASVARDACPLLPDCELVILPNGGHLLHEAQPQLAAKLILERADPVYRPSKE